MQGGVAEEDKEAEEQQSPGQAEAFRGGFCLRVGIGQEVGA